VSVTAVKYAEDLLAIINKGKENRLPASACSVYFLLAWKANEESWKAWVGAPRISSVLGMHPVTVSKAFKILEAYDLIRIDHRDGTTNMTHIIEHDLEGMSKHYNPQPHAKGKT